MRLKFICFTLLMSGYVAGQNSPNALWLRHSCGYTDGVSNYGGNVFGDAVCADRFGNSYNSGYFSGNWFTMDTVIEMNTNRFYINKYNSKGKRIWTAKAKGTTINSIMSATRMECDENGFIYICGTFSVDDSVYMAPNWYPIGSGFVAKYDSFGNNVWCKYISKKSTTSAVFSDISIVGSKLYLCGTMNYGTIHFGTFVLNSKQSQNGLLAMLDLNGNVIQAEFLDSNVTNEIYGIEASKISNSVYIVGQYLNGNLNRNGLYLNNRQDATNSFIIKMNSVLTAQWMRGGYTSIPGTGGGVWGTGEKCLKSVEIDKFDNVYSIGNGNGDTTRFGKLFFNHQTSTPYKQDVYVVKYNSSGVEQWLKYGSSPENDYVFDIMTDDNGNSVISVFSGSNALGNIRFDSDSISRWHGGLVKYSANGDLIYAKELQEARFIKQLAKGPDSVFFATGNGISYGSAFDTIQITGCEHPVYAQSSVNSKMFVVKFNDKSSALLKNSNIKSKNIYVKSYPNPVSEFVSISTDHSELLSIHILDIYGREIFNSPFKNEISIHTSNFSKGIYYYTISDKYLNHFKGSFLKL